MNSPKGLSENQSGINNLCHIPEALLGRYSIFCVLGTLIVCLKVKFKVIPVLVDYYSRSLHQGRTAVYQYSRLRHAGSGAEAKRNAEVPLAFHLAQTVRKPDVLSLHLCYTAPLWTDFTMRGHHQLRSRTCGLIPTK